MFYRCMKVMISLKTIIVFDSSHQLLNAELEDYLGEYMWEESLRKIPSTVETSALLINIISILQKLPKKNADN